jgi:hypothetical protein
LYPVNKSGIHRLFVTFLTMRGLRFPQPENAGAKSKKAGMKAGLPQLAVGVA